MGGGGGEEDGQGAASPPAGPGAGPRSSAQGGHFPSIILKAAIAKLPLFAFYLVISSWIYTLSE